MREDTGMVVVTYVLLLMPFLLVILLAVLIHFFVPEKKTILSERIHVKRFGLSSYFNLTGPLGTKYIKEVLPDMADIVREDVVESDYPTRLYALKWNESDEILLCDIRKLPFQELMHIERKSELVAVYLNSDTLKINI